MKLIIILVIGVLNYSTSALAGGGTWSEFGDVQSFPDGQPQVTRGAGELTLITGSTFPTSDPRNAYCIKITDPTNFIATTDNNTINTANTDFDTRLFLFDKKGKPLLFNDDGFGSLASTLTSVTTDGSGYILTQPGEYILVIAGFADDPLDNIGTNLFNQSALLVHSPIPNSNHFFVWENSSPATGSYLVALQDVSYCQDKLDIVGTNSSLTKNSQMCSGDGNSGFDNCHTDSISSEKTQIVTGYLDNDEHLDVIFDAYIGDIPSVCLGDGKGGYKSCSVYAGLGTNRTDTTLMGDINNDGFTDAVFIGSTVNLKACLGDGTGFFTGCTDVINSGFIATNSAQLAYIDGDSNLDLIYSTFSELRICSGDGNGGFNACVITVVDSASLEVTDVNHDGSNDILTIQDGGTNKVCLNNGVGGLTCNDISAQTNRTNGLAVGDLNNDGHSDVVFANVNGLNPGINQACLGDGNGAFTCSNVSGATGAFANVKLGLINDDNILDVVFAGFGDFTRICTGNGDGAFSNCSNDTSLPFFDIELGEFGKSINDVFADGFE